MMINYLRDMGASIEIKHNALGMRKSRLKAIRADLSDCIDLLPTMAILAAKAEGTSKLTGIERARIKESNRVAAVREGLERMGIKTTEEQNELTIIGSKPRGAIIDSKNDHRIAMAFSILGSTVGNTIINKAECVSKTYPEFWDELKGTGGKIRIDG
jgi:3-phosphoshikimate 1-carboxyvinyltransferase